MTTYLTIDSSGAHGNNGYKTFKGDLPWSGKGYKKPLASERTISALFGNKSKLVQLQSSRPTKCYQKDFMPTNGCVKPFVGINLAKNRIRGPQIFSTRKWT